MVDQCAMEQRNEQQARLSPPSIMNGDMVHRRSPKYREPPRRCFKDNIENSSPRNSPRSGGTTSSSSFPRFGGASSFLRIGNQSGIVATSFAAAIAPPSAYHKRGMFGKLGMGASTPLLGPGKPSSSKKNNKRRASFRSSSFLKKGSSKNLTSTADADGEQASQSGMSKRRSLSKAIKAPLKNVSSKLSVASKRKRRKKKLISTSEPTGDEKPSVHPTEYSRFGGSACTSESGSGCNLKAIGESIGESLGELGIINAVGESTSTGSLAELSIINAQQEASAITDEPNFVSLNVSIEEPKRELNTSTRLTPLTFDDTKVSSPNPFRGAAVGGDPAPTSVFSSRPTTPTERDEFSLEKVLSRSFEVAGPLASPTESEIAYEQFLDEIGKKSSSAFETRSSPSSVPSPGYEQFLTEMGRLETRCSPTTSSPFELATAFDMETSLLDNQGPFELATAFDMETSLLDNTLDHCSMPSLNISICSLGSQLSKEDENRLSFDEALNQVSIRRASGRSSIPDEFNESYNSFVRQNSKGLTAEEELAKEMIDVGLGMPNVDSSDSIPTVVTSNVPVIPMPQEPMKTDEAADSALAWGALSMILGSPAPSSVLMGEKKKQKRNPVNLWLGDDGDALVPDDLDDIFLPDQDDDLSNIAEEDLVDVSDNCSIPSVSSEAGLEIDIDILPDIDDYDDQAFITPKSTNVKESAGTTLAWTALCAVLGSPAPSSVTKKTCAPKSSLFEDGEDQLPDIVEEDQEIDFDELPDIEEDAVAYSTESQANKEESADSVLAWSALGMLLGSPAPAPVSKKSRRESRKAALSLFEISEDDAIPSIDTEGDNESIPDPLCGDYQEEIIPDVEDLMQSGTPLEFNTNKKEAAESVLSWSVLGALLGSPAPVSVTGKKKQARRSVKNLWADDDAEDDLDKLLPFAEEDAGNLPSLLGSYDDDDSDDHSIPSLSDTYEGSLDTPNRSPLTLGGGPSEDLTSSPKGVTDDVIAWGAFAALMGAPAPKAVQSRRRRESNVFSDSSSEDEDFPSIDRSPGINLPLMIGK